MELDKLKGKISTLIGNVLGRSQMAYALGQTYDGKRDMYSVLGYKRTLAYQDYLNLYTRTHIAARIIEAPVRATWSGPPQIVGSERLKETWAKLDRKHRIFNKIERADIVTGIGEFGILLIGLADGRGLSEPAGTSLGANGLLYLAPYGQGHVEIESFSNDPRSSRFGKPEIYKIRPDAMAGARAKVPEMRVHWSRIIHLAEGLLEDEIFGTPQLQSVYNLFDDLAKIVGGSAEFFWRIADRGIQFDMDKDSDIGEDAEEELEDEIEKFIHGLNRTVLTRGVTAKVLGSETSDPRGPFDSVLKLISGAKGFPQRILTGSERGQLASSEDRASWSGLITDRRREYAWPIILYPLIERLQSFGILPSSSVDIHWPLLFPQSEEEKSVIAARISSSSRNIATAIEKGYSPLTANQFRRHYLDLQDEKEEAELETEMKAIRKKLEDAEKDKAAQPAKLPSTGGDERNVED